MPDDRRDVEWLWQVSMMVDRETGSRELWLVGQLPERPQPQVWGKVEVDADFPEEYLCDLVGGHLTNMMLAARDSEVALAPPFGVGKDAAPAEARTTC